MESYRVLGELEISPQDERTYRLIELDNKLQVVLIHDKDTDKASVAMDVGVGSLRDGDIEGLAHFCEHMLFLGTDKYPDENSYSKYLNQHAGRSNAYTDTDHTNYYFEVNHDSLEGSMDRFAQFFLGPLFTESATNREMKAVDSENSKNLQQDMWRLHQLHCGAAKKGHPLSQFMCGSLKTLQDNPQAAGVNVRDKLLEFHSRYYSANIMSLVVLGRESLDELCKMVVDKFSKVKNLDIPRPRVGAAPYGREETGRVWEVVPVMDLRQVHLSWPLPSYQQHYKASPSRYLSHLLGHEGEGSILSYLKDKGWANELSAGPHLDGAEWSSMDVVVELTDAGVDHVWDVIKVVYAYLHMMRQQGVQEWIWEEMRQISDNSFRFLSKQQPWNYTSAVAARLKKYEPTHAVSGPYLVREFNPSLTEDIMGRMTPDNMLVFITSKTYTGKTTLTEQWYGVAYNERTLDTDFVGQLAKGELPTTPDKSDGGKAVSLHLPRKNDFIPSNFDLVHPTSHTQGRKVPVALRDSSLSRLWYKHDENIFKQPKAYFATSLTTPVISESATSSVLTSMLSRMTTDALSEFSYNATVAGLHYSLTSNSTTSSLNTTIYGYSHKLPLLASTVFQKLRSPDTISEAQDELFWRLQDQLVKDYTNELYNMPYALVNTRSQHLLASPYSLEERLEAAKSITPKQLREFAPRVLQCCKLESLVYGNMTESQALSLLDMVESTLGHPSPLPPSIHPANTQRVVMLDPEEEYHHTFPLSNPDETNHGVEVTFITQPQEVGASATLDLLCHLGKDEAFNELRTKQQLGYIVHMGATAYHRHVQGVMVLVQTEQVEPVEVEKRVEAFLHYLRHDYLQNMSQEVFESHVKAVVEQKLEKAKNYVEQAQRYSNEVNKGTYIFDRAEKEANYLATGKVSKEDLLAFFDRYVGPDGGQRRKMVVAAVGTGKKHEDEEAGEEVQGQNGDQQPVSAAPPPPPPPPPPAPP